MLGIYGIASRNFILVSLWLYAKCTDRPVHDIDEIRYNLFQSTVGLFSTFSLCVCAVVTICLQLFSYLHEKREPVHSRVQKFTRMNADLLQSTAKPIISL